MVLRIVLGKVDLPGARALKEGLIEAEKQKLRKRRAEVSADLLAKMAAEALLEKSSEPGEGEICLKHSEVRKKCVKVASQQDGNDSKYVNMWNSTFECYDKETFERSIKEWLASIGYSGDVTWKLHGRGDWKLQAKPASC